MGPAELVHLWLYVIEHNSGYVYGFAQPRPFMAWPLLPHPRI